uniref:Uncharacterized protein n=1 Tax=Cryptomonas curvata TaxID=233186 RepID=A0A7S0N0N2_9CRYP|mmetsp:Transcript_58633/g.122518  ORF Transcript_58633/g.122518 Transcript_58633/m.122518 type:complete len:153 (+) Transcript_58633:72-530(+)
MGVTTAFVSALIVGVPLLIVFIVAMVIWRCNVVSARKKKRIYQLEATPRPPTSVPFIMRENTSQGDDSISESDSSEIRLHSEGAISSATNTEVIVSASFTMAKDYNRNILQTCCCPTAVHNIPHDSYSADDTVTGNHYGFGCQASEWYVPDS